MLEFVNEQTGRLHASAHELCVLFLNINIIGFQLVKKAMTGVFLADKSIKGVQFVKKFQNFRISEFQRVGACKVCSCVQIRIWGQGVYDLGFWV